MHRIHTSNNVRKSAPNGRFVALETLRTGRGQGCPKTDHPGCFSNLNSDLPESFAKVIRRFGRAGCLVLTIDWRAFAENSLGGGNSRPGEMANSPFPTSPVAHPLQKEALDLQTNRLEGPSQQ